MRAVTIGVYGWSGEEFVAALHDAGVATLLDIRRRRGVRGREYAWANSKRLQAALGEAGIAYEHHLELAPTPDVRAEQKRADTSSRIGPRARERMAPEFARRYEAEVLDAVDLEALTASLPGTFALMCVEGEPAACHRSIVAERLGEMGAAVHHLLPDR